MAATATIPANTLLPRTFSWLAPRRSPLLGVSEEEPPDPEPCWKPPLLPPLPLSEPPASVGVEPILETGDELSPESPESPEVPEWVSAPGPAPERPGIVAAVLLGLDPLLVAEDSTFPASMSSPVAINEARTVGSLPSMTVLFVPKAEL